MVKTTPFDPADYLDTPERIAAYLTEALETNDAEFIADAIGIVARSKGMTAIAKKAGLSREGLYDSLSRKGNPELKTLLKIFDVLGVQLTIKPKAA